MSSRHCLGYKQQKLLSVIPRRNTIICLSDDTDQASNIISFKKHVLVKISFEIAAAYNFSLRKLQLLTYRICGGILEQGIILRKLS